MTCKTLRTGLLFILLTTFYLSAQAQCNGRYKNVQFDSVTVTSDIQYGQSVNLAGDTVDLLLDVYEPVGDTLTERPIIIFAHGGSFISGSKNNGAIEEVCEKMALRGFVTASINYRLTDAFSLVDSVTMVKETIMAAQDGKAAVRYFRKDADINGNQFRIDTDQVFMGGNSAGAILALHLGYVDENESATIDPDIQTIIDQIGGIEGNSGNPGYSSEVGAIISMSGALKTAEYLDANGPPLVSLHGTEDITVPYGRGEVMQDQPFDLITVEGSSLIHARADSLEVVNRLKTYYGAGHSPHVNSAAYMDTTINVMAEFMQKRCDCYQATGIIAQNGASSADFRVYPNPAGYRFTIRFERDAISENATYRLVNNQGQVVRASSTGSRQQEVTWQRGQLPAGLYHVVIQQTDAQTGRQQVLQKAVVLR